MTLCALPEVLGCSIVSLHAALHTDQPHPSAQMIDNTAVSYISPDALFINAGRGGLVTEEALHRMADKGVTLVLDTWPESLACRKNCSHERVCYAAYCGIHPHREIKRHRLSYRASGAGPQFG